MRIVFMGSAELACYSLEALLKDRDIDLVSVVTQPDRPKGRGRKLAACDVKSLVEKRNINVHTPQNVNSPEFLEKLKEIDPDLIVVVAYGQILKSDLLKIPPEGCINIHASLLPKYRGAAPIQWSIINGETVSGLTAMFMDEGMDTGDIISEVEVGISPDDTAGILHDRLACKGAELLIKTVHAIKDGSVSRLPQDNAGATYAPKLSRADARIDWNITAEEILNRVRGFNPWPGAWCTVAGQSAEKMTLKVFRASVESSIGKPGLVIDVSGGGPLVASSDKSLRLVEVQPEGGRIMSGVDYLLGHRLRVGDMFDAG